MSLTDVIINEYVNKVNGEVEVINEGECGHMRGLYLYARPDSGRNYGNGLAYFKCYDGPDINTANVARISFYEPKYIIHNKDSNNNFTLSSKQKKILMELLKSEYKGELVWIKLLTEFNKFLGPSSKYLLPLNLPIPDYTRLPD